MTELLDSFLSVFNSLPGVRAVLAFVLVFFLPGFAWTLIFFRGRQINAIERLALSFGLSIAIVVLSIMALNIVFDVRITGFNSVLIIIVVTVVPLIYYSVRCIAGRRGGGGDE